nr:unnamed protein product [Digitaria exilis]CAB3494976.1 unnamed protein product [Digitaria exilis]
MAADRQQGAMDGDKGCEQRRGQRCEAGAWTLALQAGSVETREEPGNAKTAEARNLGIDSVAGQRDGNESDVDQHED